MFAIVYSQKNQTLYVLPLRLSSNDGSAYPIAAFLKEQGVTQAAIEEWLKQNFLDKIVTRWLVVNGKKAGLRFITWGQSILKTIYGMVFQFSDRA